jgi:hypothetical protein
MLAPSTVPSQTTAVTLRLADAMTYSDWAQAGHQLARIAHGVAWALGDWLLYGQSRFGSRYREALAATELDYQTLRNYAWVARNVPPSRRRPALSFQHHAEIASLSEAEQELWLGRAERLGWSRNHLRRELATSRRRLLEEHGEPEVVRIQLVGPREARWREAAREAGLGIEDWLAAAADRAADAALRSDR